MFNFPISNNEFRDIYYEKQPYLMRGAANCAQLDWNLVDQALDHIEVSDNFVKLIKNKKVDISSITEEYSDIGVQRRVFRKDKLYSFLLGGGSLVLNRLDIFSQNVQEVCAQIARFLGAQTAANGYVSFGVEPATNTHWDTHDVFAVQLIGRKHWLVYEPNIELPISSQPSDGHFRNTKVAPTIDTVLEAGDILYVPRGWWHKVTPVEGVETFHLAVGIHTPLVLDYLIWACANILPLDVTFRRTVSEEDVDNTAIHEGAAALVDHLTNKANIEQFFRRVRTRERVRSSVQISKLIAPGGELNPNDILRVNTRFPSVSGKFTTINGTQIEIDEKEQEVLGRISSSTDITVASLSAHFNDEDNRRHLRNLILRDLVRVVAPN